MAFNILDAVKGFLTPDILSRAASFMGEPETSVSKALNGLIPASLLGITQKAESGGAQAILDAANKANNTGILNSLASAYSAGGGGIPDFAPGLLSSVLGDKVGGIANAIAQFAGVKGSSAATLVGSVVPLILGLIGKHASGNNLNASDLSGMLSRQKSAFMNALPPGLNLSGVVPGVVTGADRTVHEARHAVHETTQRKVNEGRWLTPVLLGVAAIALLLYLVKGCGGHKDDDKLVSHAPVTHDTVAHTEPAAAAVTRTSMMVKLPDGTELDAYRGGIEDQLVACLNDAACTAGKDRWFDFDNLNFETGSSTLTGESQKQVGNLVAILKAYPKLKIKIGGYTDKTGDAAANQKLSQDRAEAVMNAIKSSGGAAGQVTGAEGYGSQFAKIPETASDEERKVDRRISVQVREK